VSSVYCVDWLGLIWAHLTCQTIKPSTEQALTEQLKRTRDEEELGYLNSKMQAVIARLYCMTGQSKVQGPSSVCLSFLPAAQDWSTDVTQTNLLNQSPCQQPHPHDW
jgi:hypothetical protein